MIFLNLEVLSLAEEQAVNNGSWGQIEGALHMDPDRLPTFMVIILHTCMLAADMHTKQTQWVLKKGGHEFGKEN